MRAAWLALALLAAPAPARAADPAPGDSLLHHYLGSLRDSTDAYFGLAAAATDTTGLDSALAAMLADGGRGPRRGRGANAPRLAPALGFQRVDGLLAGITTGAGAARGGGRLDGRLQWAVSAEELHGGAEYTLRRGRRDEGSRWTLSLRGERVTVPFDRDFFDPAFTALQALTQGSDRHDYLTRSGFEAGLAREGAGWRVRAALRDHIERARVTATDWNLARATLARPDNRAAHEGRVREARIAASARVPHTAWRVEGQYATSGAALASDFTYRRMRAALGGDVALVDRIALVPSMEYGRLRGEPVAQQAFFLGGANDLRTLERNALHGTGRVVAAVDLVHVGDVLDRLRLPHPAWLNLSPLVFTHWGAVWGAGRDGGGPVADPRDGPRAGDWLGEAGVGLLWRLGVPEPDVGLRLDVAWPVGPEDERGVGVTIGLQGALGLLRVR